MEYHIRTMTVEDYPQVYNLWMSIHKFAMRSIDDSREGVERFLKRNPGISVVAEAEGRIVGAILCGHDGRRAGLYHVCVREDCRKHGIGKAMVTACSGGCRRRRPTRFPWWLSGTTRWATTSGTGRAGNCGRI